jgi:hypothetical protein
MGDTKASAVMVLCDANNFGGDDDVELLWEPWGKGLLDRTEGLVLLGLGLVVMVSCVVTLLGRVSQGTKDGGSRARGMRQEAESNSGGQRVAGWACAEDKERGVVVRG